jgi:two-component system chemotaxis response regulator CheB
MNGQAQTQRRGVVSGFTCRECGGLLWQVDETGRIRFRCHLGHADNGEVLLAEQTETLEAALWTAVRIFREQSVLGPPGRRPGARQGERRRRRPVRFEEQAAHSYLYGSLIVRHVRNADATTAAGAAEGGSDQASTP